MGFVGLDVVIRCIFFDGGLWLECWNEERVQTYRYLKFGGYQRSLADRESGLCLNILAGLLVDLPVGLLAACATVAHQLAAAAAT